MSENLKRYFICIFYFQLSTSQGAAGILVSPQKTTPTTSVALQELKEQFEAYRYSSLPSSPSLPSLLFSFYCYCSSFPLERRKPLTTAYYRSKYHNTEMKLLRRDWTAPHLHLRYREVRVQTAHSFN